MVEGEINCDESDYYDMAYIQYKYGYDTAIIAPVNVDGTLIDETFEVFSSQEAWFAMMAPNPSFPTRFTGFEPLSSESVS